MPFYVSQNPNYTTRLYPLGPGKEPKPLAFIHAGNQNLRQVMNSGKKSFPGRIALQYPGKPRIPSNAPMTKPLLAPPIDCKWLIFAALGSGVFLASFNIGIANVILPTLVVEFNVDFALVQWVLLSFTLTQTAISPAVGRLGDMLGHKPIFLWGTIAFALGSILAACTQHRASCWAFVSCRLPAAPLPSP